jgi:hypothetical protein
MPNIGIELHRPLHLPGCRYTSANMNIVPTSAAMPRQRIIHCGVLTGSFFLRC